MLNNIFVENVHRIYITVFLYQDKLHLVLPYNVVTGSLTSTLRKGNTVLLYQCLRFYDIFTFFVRTQNKIRDVALFNIPWTGSIKQNLLI